MTLISLSIILGIVAAVAGWWFVILYWREAWRETEAGRHLMHFTAGMAIIMTWSVGGIIIRLWFGNPEWLEIPLAVGRTMIFGWAGWMLIERLRLLQKAIRQRKMQAAWKGDGSYTEQGTE